MEYFKSKRCLFGLLLVSTTLYANDISVYNESTQEVIIKNSDGSGIVVPAKGQAQRVHFNNHSIVTAYVNGKSICQWHIDFHDANGASLSHLIYWDKENKPRYHFQCESIYRFITQ